MHEVVDAAGEIATSGQSLARMEAGGCMPPVVWATIEPCSATETPAAAMPAALARSCRMPVTSRVRPALPALLALLVAALTPRAHAAPNALETLSFKVGDAERRAIVVNAPAAGEKRPAVIILHGGMGSAEGMRAGSGFDPVARANGFIAVYAEGTEYGAVEGRHAWNTGHLLRRQVQDADDIAYLDQLIDRMVSDHGADPARIFMTGGSNGGMMTFVYAAKRPERLAAAAPVVASMFAFDVVPKVPLPILIINGARDEEVPLAGGMSRNAIVRAAQATPFKPLREVVDFWVKANQSRTEGTTNTEGSVTTTTYAAGDGGAVTEFVVDREGGHGWPGAPARRGGSPPIMAFRGAERVWEFFAGKSRASPGLVGAAPCPIEVIELPDLVDAARDRRVPIKVHAPSVGGPHPVIVLSHGAGGDWDTHHAQAGDLAANGYVVLCLEHVGSNRGRLTQGLRPMRNLEAMTRDAHEVLARPKDVSFAIDRAVEWNRSHDRLQGRLDVSRIGVMGHSFGAFTTMVACGARPALDWLEPPVAPGAGLGPDLHDPRVRCGVALSPQGVGEPFFIRDSFASLRVPLLGISGTKDSQQAGRPAENRKDAFALWSTGAHRFVWLENARHVDFADSSGSGVLAWPSSTRKDTQPVTRAATLAFFDLHLKSRHEAADRLTVDALSRRLRGEISRVEVLAK